MSVNFKYWDAIFKCLILSLTEKKATVFMKNIIFSKCIFYYNTFFFNWKFLNLVKWFFFFSFRARLSFKQLLFLNTNFFSSAKFAFQTFYRILHIIWLNNSIEFYVFLTISRFGSTQLSLFVYIFKTVMNVRSNSPRAIFLRHMVKHHLCLCFGVT